MPPSIVYTRIPEAALRCNCAEALSFGVADLHEAMGPLDGKRTLMDPAMRGLNAGLRLAGPAVTAYCDAGDNLMVQKALRLAEPGQVVVLSNGGGHQGALFGEMMGTYVLQRQLAGVVVHGPIRDVDALRRMQVPVWSTWVSPSHPERRGPGAVNVPMACAGITVHPGDIIVADGDGVIAIPPHAFGRVVEAARQRVAKEAGIIAALRRGEHLYDLTGAEDALRGLGIEERDTDWESWQRSACVAAP
ncbi:demethylmenaquinone methyltransferase [Bordetella bronchiseptica E014]|nr:RraA family protein [Bordetella bronchiseptica]KDC23010.1 demethylmenaquinone methyltransferase [Bordetella bronchiseptica E014]